MFTRQHFVAVAKVLRALPVEAKVLNETIEKFAAIFAESNDQFDRARFFKAAGHTDSVR